MSSTRVSAHEAQFIFNALIHAMAGALVMTILRLDINAARNGASRAVSKEARRAARFLALRYFREHGVRFTPACRPASTFTLPTGMDLGDVHRRAAEEAYWLLRDIETRCGMSNLTAMLWPGPTAQGA